MYSHFMNKQITEFWKTWNSKFRKNTSKQVNINGHVSDIGIANEFATYFKQVFHSSNDQETCDEYLCKRKECINENLCASYKCIESVTVERLDKCMQKLNLGKACGPDDLCAEHLLYSHPILFKHLQVPNSFGIGVTVPLIKDKTGNVNDC